MKQLWVSDFCGFILVIWWSNQCDVFLLAACCQFSQVQDVFLQAVQHDNLTFYAGYPSSCSSTRLSRLGTDTRRTLAHHDWVQHDHSLADRGHNPPSSFRLFGLPFLTINNKKECKSCVSVFFVPRTTSITFLTVLKPKKGLCIKVQKFRSWKTKPKLKCEKIKSETRFWIFHVKSCVLPNNLSSKHNAKETKSKSNDDELVLKFPN